MNSDKKELQREKESVCGRVCKREKGERERLRYLCYCHQKSSIQKNFFKIVQSNWAK